MNNQKWDSRFIDLAKLVASWSKDPSTKVGAVIVRHDRTVASLGFNGFPRFMRDSRELYDNREEKYSRIVHAEVNALIHACAPVTGCTLYTWPFFCCDRCAVQVIQAGIIRCVSPSPPADITERWGESFNRAKKYFRESEVEYKEI